MAGSGGNSGMAGTMGKPSFASVDWAGALMVGDVEVVTAGARETGGGVVGDFVDGHAGALLSAASDVPFVPANGGTPSGDWETPLEPARVGSGPSLILMYKYTPT